MPVIVSFCASEFILHRRLTLLALRLPSHMRFHCFAAHLLFPAAVSISRSAAAVPRQNGWLTINFPSDLSFARSVDLQDRVRSSLAVPSSTALPISAASCNSCMRLVFVTGCVDVLFANRSSNHVPQCLDQFPQQTSGPRAALETTCQNAGCTTSDDVAVSVANLKTSRRCVSTSPKPVSRAGSPLPPAAESASVL